MTNQNTSLVLATSQSLPVFSIGQAAALAKSKALENSALIAKVTDRDSKIIAVRSQQELKGLISSLEKCRQELKEPILAAGRSLDTLIATEKLALEQEFGRVSNVVKEFDDAERRRVLEEERLQREEVERIERERQAEVKRLADEQAAREAEVRRQQAEVERKVQEAKAAAERVAREAREAAEKLAREATNKKQREAAEAARVKAEKEAAIAQQESDKRAKEAAVEKERQDAKLAEQAAAVAAQTAAVEEKAGDAAYVASRPIEITRVAGQRTNSNWVIVVEQPFVLAKFHPDLVDIKPRLGDIKSRLNEGMEVKGIKATRETTSSVRVPAEKKAIDV